MPLQKGTEKILVVDDDPKLVDMMVEMLQTMGYDVESRTSSIDVLALFKAKPYSFDFVITDMSLSNMNGTELAVKIARINPEIPIIICSGYRKNIDEEKAKIFGFKN